MKFTTALAILFSSQTKAIESYQNVVRVDLDRQLAQKKGPTDFEHVQLNEDNYSVLRDFQN